jgi:hypothetical protein
MRVHYQSPAELLVRSRSNLGPRSSAIHRHLPLRKVDGGRAPINRIANFINDLRDRAQALDKGRSVFNPLRQRQIWPKEPDSVALRASQAFGQCQNGLETCAFNDRNAGSYDAASMAGR